jgi:hypothetical protein
MPRERVEGEKGRERQGIGTKDKEVNARTRKMRRKR